MLASPVLTRLLCLFRPVEWLSDLARRPSQFDTDDPLQLGEQLLIRNRLALLNLLDLRNKSALTIRGHCLVQSRPPDRWPTGSAGARVEATIKPKPEPMETHRLTSFTVELTCVARSFCVRALPLASFFSVRACASALPTAGSIVAGGLGASFLSNAAIRPWSAAGENERCSVLAPRQHSVDPTGLGVQMSGWGDRTHGLSSALRPLRTSPTLHRTAVPLRRSALL